MKKREDFLGLGGKIVLSKYFINTFIPNAPFLYPLKTSKNLTVFWCFQGVEKGCIGNYWVKFITFNFKFKFKFIIYLLPSLLTTDIQCMHSCVSMRLTLTTMSHSAWNSSSLIILTTTKSNCTKSIFLSYFSLISIPRSYMPKWGKGGLGTMERRMLNVGGGRIMNGGKKMVRNYEIDYL